jgi:glyoxylase-like metal-dependent hydrolase (beta-lactamase superfamily II)
MAPFLPPFVDALPKWVARTSLPTPFRVGDVNCYLLADPPVTIIDPGTLMPGSLEQLEGLLGANGRRLSDVEQVVVTHAHPDHFGAAAAVVSRSGGRIVCGLPEVAGLIGPTDPQPLIDLLVRLGVPRSRLADLLGTVALDTLIAWAAPGQVIGVEDGATLAAGGRQLQSIVTPGHSAGHLSLWDPEERALFSGDHLLARIIPVPRLGAGISGDCDRREGLIDYLDSLPRFAGLDPAVVLPGHGRPFTGMEVLAARVDAHSHQRAEDIARILADGPATPFQVTERLLWQPEGSRLLAGIAHVQGHLNLLEVEQRVLTETAEVTRYRLRS